MLNAIRAEQIKLTTLRSTWWSIGFVVVVSLGVGLLIAGVVDGEPEEPVDTVTILFLAAALIALVGVMAMAVITATGEYRFGQVRLSLTAVPHRWKVLLAKAFVSIVAAFVIGAVTAWSIVFLSGPLLPADWKIDLGAEGVQRVIWGLPMFFTVAALLALSLGMLLRNSPAAITILTVLSLVVEKTLLGIPQTQDWAAYLPFNAGIRITQPDDGDRILMTPWAGYWLFVAYAVGLFLVALIVTERRDA
jgi:ABC-2 type transport system permease protein